MTDRYESIDAADRWFHDGLCIVEPLSFFVVEEVEMTATRELITELRQQGVQGTYTHVIVRAVALALSRHPELNRLILHRRMVYPDTIDIALTVSSADALSVPPTLVLQDAGSKTLIQVAQEIIQRVPEVRAKEPQRLVMLRKAIRLFPASWMRRILLRLMLSHLSTLKTHAGTFLITSLPHLHQGVPFKPPTRIVLAFARVEDRVVARNGQIVVRPMVTLSLAGDNRLWNANSAALLLNEVKKLLEDGELAEEISSAQVS